MTADDDTPHDGEMVSDEPTRRKFLGAAAAVATLPSTTDTSRSKTVAPDVSTDDTAASRATFPQRGELWGALHLSESVDEDSRLTVQGYSYDDDEHPAVAVDVYAGIGTLHLSMSTERAVEIARDLERAAAFAEGRR